MGADFSKGGPNSRRNSVEPPNSGERKSSELSISSERSNSGDCNLSR